MNEFHFLRPYCLLLFIPLIIFLLLTLRKTRSSNIWDKICSKDLIPYITVKKGRQNNSFLISVYLGLSLLILALAGPTWQLINQPLIKTQSGLVIALDLTPAMNAQDIKPTRLQRAVFKIKDLLNLRHEGQTSLIVFTGEPFVVTPLTDDVSTIKALLPVIDTSLMPVQGHNVSEAIKKAGELLKQAGITNGDVLVITADLSSEDLEESIRESKSDNLRVSILGIGTEENTPIPSAKGGFLTDAKGALVITKLAKDNLLKLAQSTHGTYSTITVNDSDIEKLNKSFLHKDAIDSSSQELFLQNKWFDQGYLLVLLALPFILLLFRRGSTVLILLFLPTTLSAFSWDDLWQTPNQQAQRYFNEQEFAKAKDLFQNENWKAAADYKAGDFLSAINHYQNDPSADGFYNLGNSIVKIGDLEAALEAYTLALELDPTHEDAEYNKKLIEELLQKKNQNKDKKEDKDKDKNSEKNKSENNKDEKESSDNKEDSESKEDKENQEDKQDSNENESNKDDEKSKEDSKKENDLKDSDEKKSESEKSAENKENPNESTDQEKYSQQIQKELNESTDKAKNKVAMEDDQKNEQRQIDNKFLERVIDDPGALLRRKFQQQYHQRNMSKQKQ